MNGEKIKSLQVLRAIAALMVVLHHSKDFAAKYGYDSDYLRFLHSGFGAFGVDIFFVLSGTIMFLSTRGGIKGNQFLFKRLLRVAPLYWSISTFLAGLLLFFPFLFGSMQFDLGHYLLSVLFILHQSPSGDHLPLLGVGWTLCFEMYFYLIFAFLLRFKEATLVQLLSVYMLVASLIGLLFKFDGNYLAWMLTSAMNLEFLFGVLIGYFMRSKVKEARKTGVLLVLSGFVAAILMVDYGGADRMRGVFWGGAAAMIVLGFCYLSAIDFHRILVALGDSSYSLYLIHMLTLPFFWKIFNKMGGALSGFVVFMGSVLFTVVLAIFVWKYFEVPITRMLSGLFGRAAGRRAFV